MREDRPREIAGLQVEGLAGALGPTVLREDVREVRDTLDRVAQAVDGRRLTGAAVGDGACRVLAASDPHQAEAGISLAPLAQGARALAEITLVGGATSVGVLNPPGCRAVGRVLAELGAPQRGRPIRILLGGNALLTTIFALGGHISVRRAMRARTMSGRIMDVAGGRPTAVPPVAIHDPEVVRLFRAYNGMAAAAEAEPKRSAASRSARCASLGRLGPLPRFGG